MNFVKCEMPKDGRFRLNSYGGNQRLITAFADSGIKCAKVTDFVGNINSLSSRLTRCARNLNLMHIKAVKVDGDVYLVNTLAKED